MAVIYANGNKTFLFKTLGIYPNWYFCFENLATLVQKLWTKFKLPISRYLQFGVLLVKPIAKKLTIHDTHSDSLVRYIRQKVMSKMLSRMIKYTDTNFEGQRCDPIFENFSITNPQ
jgi:hypothetical protein